MTCECRVWLARAYAAQKDDEAAEQLLRDAVAGYRAYRDRMGEEHPAAAAADQDLVRVLINRGEPETRRIYDAAADANREAARLFAAGHAAAALECAELALASVRKLIGPNAAEVRLHLNNIAQIAGSVDPDRCAAALFELCELLPVKHVDRLRNLELLALAAAGATARATERGDKQAAALWCRRLLAAQDELKGQHSDEAVTAAWNLTQLLDAEGRRDEAMLVLIDRVLFLLTRDEQSLSSDLNLIREAAGLVTRDSRTKSGKNLNSAELSDDALRETALRVNAVQEAGRPQESLGDLQLLADEYARRHGSFHPETLYVNWMLWSNVGYSGDAAQSEQAIVQLGLILRAQRGQLGEAHPNLIGTLANLASIHVKLGRPAEAARFDEECIDTARQAFGVENPQTIAVACNAVCSAWDVGNHTGARSIFWSYLKWLLDAAPGENSEPFHSMRSRAAESRSLYRTPKLSPGISSDSGSPAAEGRTSAYQGAVPPVECCRWVNREVSALGGRRLLHDLHLPSTFVGSCRAVSRR